MDKYIKVNSRSFFWSYFLIGAIANVTVVILPIFYGIKGMDDVQKALLLSSIYISSIFQPGIGYITDVKYGAKKILKFFSILVIGISLLLFFVNNFIGLFILSFLFATFRNAMFPILDNIAIGYCKINNVSYGKIRRGGSIGFGFGVVLALPLLIFGGGSALIFLPAILCLVLYFLVNNIHTEFKKKELHIKKYGEDVKVLLSSKTYILLIIINLLLLGISSLKLSYQTILVQDLGATTLYMVFLNFMVVVPEVLFISQTKKFFSKFSMVYILMIIALINVVHSAALIASNSLFVIFIFASFHGISIAIYLPHFFEYLEDVIPGKTASMGFLINSMMQMLGSFVINVLFIVPAIIFLGVRGSFLVLLFLFLCCLLPIFLLRKSNDNYRE